MNVVAAAVGSVVPKLLQLLEGEYKLQKGVKKNVKNLSEELDSIHTCLCKVSEVPWDKLDQQLKEWASKIREASYDMEDILDTFLVRVEGHQPTGRSRMKVTMNKMTDLFRKGKARHDVGSAINDIMKQLQEVAARRDRYRIEDLAVNSAATKSTSDPRLAAMYEEVARLVGIEKPSNDIIAKLQLSACQERKTVSIFGIGGLGKTTLAKSVYDKLSSKFECRAFVPVGRNPKLSKVLGDILYELDKNRFANIHTLNRDERQLIDNLREFLMDKRYFIVIDDIWETTSWEATIRLAMLDNNRGSRIIITTRNSQVATEIGDEVYKMQPLPYDNSKKLFYTRIFGAMDKWPDNEPDEIPNKILKKCDGVPLAIITMASLLVGKARERWSEIYTCVGFGHKDDKQVDNTMKILSFSYYDMPAYLRTCLLYLSVFPEDYEIHKNTLIWMWIAEGFIQGKQGIQLFELGEQYFNDLVNRSMVQATDVEFDGIVQWCRVHDMVLDLIRFVSSQEKFVTILDKDEGTVSPEPRIARKLALHGNILNHTAQANTVDITQVRSFVLIGCSFSNWVPLSRYKLLRVLDLEYVTSGHLLHLENLLHLRYLGLRDCAEVDDLPNGIGGLKFLQTLNLETKIRLLTPSISRLTQLVCLKCIWSPTLAPEWIGNLTSLEELQVRIDFSNRCEEEHARGFLKALGSLRGLRRFKIFIKQMDKSMQRDLVLSLRNLHKLQNLDIEFLDLPTADPDLWGQDFVFPQHVRVLHLKYLWFIRFPSCIGAAYLPNLTHLSLQVAHMDEKDLEFLGRLPELCYLLLETLSTVTIHNISASSGYFQKLRFCYMRFSTIQFLCGEGESSVSFCIWNGRDIIPFGSSKNNGSLTPFAALPNLEVLGCQIMVRGLKDSNGDCSNVIGMEYLPSLRRVKFYINCKGASAAEVDEVEAVLWKATQVHSNRPTFGAHRCFEDEMISAVQEQKPEDDVVDVSEEEEDQKRQLTAHEDVTK